MKTEDLVREYDVNVDLLVIEKANYKNSIISGQLFIVSKEEWYSEEIFYLYEAKLDGNKVSMYLACGEYVIVHKAEQSTNKILYQVI